tara:strand:- start:998 stop:1630 length:633 start_codon:yes stop_codon:yes gene_type:complete
MNIISENKEFPYILIDDFYNQSELDDLWEELDYMCNPRRMARAAVENGAAWDRDEDGNKNLLKNNWTMWLDGFFAPDRQRSNILEVNRKLLNNVQIFENHPHWAINDTAAYKSDFTQIAYYEDSDEYLEHRDNARLSCLTWFYREPKKFTGGTLYFPLWDIKIECKHNRVICFPSMIPHGVTKVSMNKEDMGKKLGRFVMTQFLKLDESV